MTAAEVITAIRECPRNRRHPVLTTGANPKAGRDVGRGTPSRQATYKPSAAGLVLLFG
jgi:hypothetical protein